MNPGISDEAGKAAQSTIEALKSTPVILALVIFNVLYMGSTFYLSLKNAERFERMLGLCYSAYKMQSDESRPAELPPP